MNLREERLKEIRRREQEKSLEELKKQFDGFLKGFDFNMQIEVTLDNYLPEYHLNYNRDVLFSYLKKISEKMIIQVESYTCFLFREIEPFSEGWYYYCDGYYGGSIYIKNDGIIIYNWHYKYEPSDTEYSFQSVLITAYFTMFLCFLPLFYRSIIYFGRIHLKININGIEKCVFYPPGEVTYYNAFNSRCELPIKRIIPLDLLITRDKKTETIHYIITKILSYCFDYTLFRIPEFCINIINQYSEKEL